MMKAIMVNESNGIYEINPNAEVEELDPAEHTINLIEPLMGWGQWTTACLIDGQTYFIDEAV